MHIHMDLAIFQENQLPMTQEQLVIVKWEAQRRSENLFPIYPQLSLSNPFPVPGIDPTLSQN